MKKLSLLFICVLALSGIGCEMKASSDLTEDSEVGMSVNFERTTVYNNDSKEVRLRMILSLRDDSDASTIKVGEGELSISAGEESDDLYDNFIPNYPFAFLGTSQASYISDLDHTVNLENGSLDIHFSVGERDYSANIQLPEPIDFAANASPEGPSVLEAQLKAEWEQDENISHVEITDCASLQNITYMSCTATEDGVTLKSRMGDTPDINIHVDTQHPDSEVSVAKFVIAMSEDLQPEFDFQGFDSVNVKLIEKAIREVVQR